MSEVVAQKRFSGKHPVEWAISVFFGWVVGCTGLGALVGGAVRSRCLADVGHAKLGRTQRGL